MTVKGDSADAPLAAATTVPADNDGNNNNDAIPLASAVAVPIGGGDAGVVPLPVPMPPPAEENVVVKTVKTTKTYTIPAPSASNNSAAPSAPPATATAGGSSSSSPRLLKDLGRQPVSITCPHCNQVGLTRVESRCDAGSGASAAILCVVGFFCCICLAFAACLPCCVDKMQATEHRCSKCNRVVGKVRSFSDC
jgi:hypothetical protein